MKKISVTSRITDLFPILDTYFKERISRPRLKLRFVFVIAHCKVQTVGFEKLSKAFDSEKVENENLSLCIDRTKWKLGQADINILMLGITYQGVAFPLLFKMLNKRGKLNTRERIELIERFIQI